MFNFSVFQKKRYIDKVRPIRRSSNHERVSHSFEALIKTRFLSGVEKVISPRSSFERVLLGLCIIRSIRPTVPASVQWGSLRQSVCQFVWESLGGGYFQSFQQGSVKSPWHSRAWYFERGAGSSQPFLQVVSGSPSGKSIAVFLGNHLGGFPTVPASVWWIPLAFNCSGCFWRGWWWVAAIIPWHFGGNTKEFERNSNMSCILFCLILCKQANLWASRLQQGYADCQRHVIRQVRM